MANSIYAELNEHLKKIHGVYLEIRECFAQEREALINFDFDVLHRVNCRKEELVGEIHKLENARELLVEDLHMQFQLADEPKKMATYIPLIPLSWKEEITRTSEELDELMNECLERYNSNKRFIDDSVKNMRSLSQNYQRHVGTMTEVYSRDGNVRHANITVMRKKV